MEVVIGTVDDVVEVIVDVVDFVVDVFVVFIACSADSVVLDIDASGDFVVNEVVVDVETVDVVVGILEDEAGAVELVVDACSVADVDVEAISVTSFPNTVSDVDVNGVVNSDVVDVVDVKDDIAADEVVSEELSAKALIFSVSKIVKTSS